MRHKVAGETHRFILTHNTGDQAGSGASRVPGSYSKHTTIRDQASSELGIFRNYPNAEMLERKTRKMI